MSPTEGGSALSHLTGGEAQMVDVSAKEPTLRSATARSFVSMSPDAIAAVRTESLGKGDVLGVAKVAGIMAAKKTADLIPLCHPLALTDVQVGLELLEDGVRIQAHAKTTGPTGVEMEALTAAAVAALTVYDMCKSVDRSMTVEKIELVSKEGGRSGTWRRDG